MACSADSLHGTAGNILADPEIVMRGEEAGVVVHHLDRQAFELVHGQPGIYARVDQGTAQPLQMLAEFVGTMGDGARGVEYRVCEAQAAVKYRDRGLFFWHECPVHVSDGLVLLCHATSRLLSGDSIPVGR